MNENEASYHEGYENGYNCAIERLKELIGNCQPVGKIGEIQKIFGIKYEPFDSGQ